MLARCGGIVRALGVGVATLALLGGAGEGRCLALAAGPVSGTSDDAAQQEARRQIPYDKLSRDARRKVDAVLSSVTLYRRMPTQVIRCDPDLYHFMTTRPDVTVNLWQVLDLSNVRLSRTGGSTFHADDAAGTKGDLQFLHATRDTLLVYAKGTYQGPLWVSPVEGGALLLLKTRHIRGSDGQDYMTARLDTFFRVDSLGIDLLTRTFQPLVNDTADKNFRDAAMFLSKLSRAAELNPDYIERLSRKLTNVSQRDREQFAELALKAAERAVKASVRKTARASESVPEPADEDEAPQASAMADLSGSANR